MAPACSGSLLCRQFAQIDPEKLRSGIKALPRDAGTSAIALVLSQIEGGRAVLERLRQTRDDLAAANARGRAAVDSGARNFSLERNSRALAAVLEFVSAWEKKPITKTGEISELLDYLEYFREAGGVIPLASKDDNAVRLMTAHAAKGLEFAHVFILRANSQFLSLVVQGAAARVSPGTARPGLDCAG